MILNGKYRMVEVPWVRSRSGSSLLISLGVLMTLMESEKPVAAVSKTVSENSFAYWVYTPLLVKKA